MTNADVFSSTTPDIFTACEQVYSRRLPKNVSYVEANSSRFIKVQCLLSTFNAHRVLNLTICPCISQTRNSDMMKRAHFLMALSKISPPIRQNLLVQFSLEHRFLTSKANGIYCFCSAIFLSVIKVLVSFLLLIMSVSGIIIIINRRLTQGRRRRLRKRCLKISFLVILIISRLFQVVRHEECVSTFHD